MSNSWDLKIDRAEHHLKEIEECITQFIESHPYQAVPGRYSRDEPNKRGYNLTFTAQPDPMLAVVIGDVVHNLRSALDHAVVAVAPSRRKRQAGFPIFSDSPFDAAGNVLNNETGKAWRKMTTGLPGKASTLIEALQPFQPPQDQRVIDFCKQHGLKPAELSGLALLGKFDNADKHRELVTIAAGLESGTITMAYGASSEIAAFDSFHEDRAELVYIDFGTAAPPEDDVHVHVSGSVRVAIEIRKERGVTGLPGTLQRLIPYVREVTKAIIEAAALKPGDPWPPKRT